MRFAELFAGAGGLSLGLEQAGHECAWHAEIEPHACAVLRHRWPAVPLYGDVSQLDGRELVAKHGPIDLLSGGSPCQDLSVAGKRAGLEGGRSGLFYQQARLWRETEAPLLLWENVPGALSSNEGNDFALILEELSGTSCARPNDGWPTAGVVHGPDGRARVAYRTLDLQWFGPPQRRRRVFLLAVAPHALDRYDPAAILFADTAVQHFGTAYRSQVRPVAQGMPRHPETRYEPGEGAAPVAGTGVAAGSDLAGSEVAQTLRGFGDWEEGGTLTNRAAKDQDFIAVPEVFPLEPGRLGGGANLGFGQQGDPQFTLQHTHHHAVAFPGTGDASGTLLGDRHDSSPCVDRGQPAIVTVPTLSTGPHFSARGTAGQDQIEYAKALHEAQAINISNSAGRLSDQVDTLASRDASGTGIGAQMQGVLMARPRRLTPLECERLMGWPDYHTARGLRANGTVYALADSSRYRLCGNGVGSPCTRWIGEALAALAAQREAA